MPASKPCWGIEIGSGSIKGVKLEAVGDGVNLLDFAIVPHTKVLSTPGLNQDDAMRVALGAFASQVDLTGATVAVSVPGHAAFARFAKLPPVEPKRVPDIVKFEAVQQIPFPLDEVEWDYQTFVSPDSPEVEVGIFAITRQKITDRLTMWQDVGLVPDLVTLSPVAAYNALAFDLTFDEQTPGTVLVDIGTTSTDLIVAEAGRVWIRTFPIGGHQFTEALVEAFKLSYPKAEKLKREAEQGQHARHVFKAMSPVFADLAQDIQRSIGYYQSLHRDAKLVRLIGLGSTFMLPGIRRFLKQQLQMNIYRLEEFKRLSPEGARAQDFKDNIVSLATAYGLALQGLDMAALEANLMPAAVLRTAMWKRKVSWFGVAAGVAIAAAAAMQLRPFLDRQAIMGAPPSSVITQAISQGTALKTKAQAVSGSASVDYTAANILSLAEGRAVYAHLVNDLGDMLAAADAKLAETPGGPPAPAFTIRRFDTEYKGIDWAKPPGSGRFEGQESGIPEGTMPRIEVKLTVTTTVPDPQPFVAQTLDPWLRSRIERPGVPYKLMLGENVWKNTVNVPIGGPAPGNELGTPPPPAPGAGGRQPPTGGRGPNRGAPVGRGGGGIGEGAGEGGGAAEGPRPPGSEALGALAPLPNYSPKPPPGATTLATFELVWTVELLPPPAPKESGT
jgi:type IV pilus assembly protein PilM